MDAESACIMAWQKVNILRHQKSGQPATESSSEDDFDWRSPLKTAYMAQEGMLQLLGASSSPTAASAEAWTWRLAFKA